MIQASCVCGAVRMEIDATPDHVTDCNCSACRRYGTLWAYFRPAEVRFLGEPNATQGFVRGDRTLELHHCKICGCITHWQPIDQNADRMGVNSRLFEPGSLSGVPVWKFDGADTWTWLSKG